MSGLNSAGWRVVLFTDYGGPVLGQIRDLFRAKGHDIAAVFTAPPPKSRAGARGYLDVVETAGSLGIPTVVSHQRKLWPALLRTFEPDLAVSCMFMWKVPEDVFTLPRLGMFNVHIGQLPEYRGTNSVGWAFRNDEGSLGATAHWMAEGWDTGPVLARGFLSYGDDDDLPSLMPGMIKTTFDVIGEALDRVALGDPGEPQDESLARNCPIFEPEWRLIDWDRPARFIHNQVRSHFGNRDQPKGALGTLDGETLVIHKTRLVTGLNSDSSSPGTVLSRDDESMLVQCADAPLKIIEWQYLSDEAGDVHQSGIRIAVD